VKLQAKDFLGRWDVKRTITDMRVLETGVLNGEAVFSDGDDCLNYREKGTLVFGGGAPLVAERSYIWRFGLERVEVLFEDGRPFHGFDLVGAPQADDHLCGDDLYKGGYVFVRWPEWKVVWNVEGPRKRYRSETIYTPL
jgi:hypothetical protein